MSKYSVKQEKLGKIKPYPENPRINAQAIDKVAASIEEFGFRQPIVVDEDYFIVVGHTRYYAAEKLGYKDVPVHVATGLSEAQIRAYRIADNRTNEEAEWDFELLAQEILKLEADGFDISLTGFNTDELNDIIDDFDEDREGETDDDDIPDKEPEPINKLGDMWLLGDHILLCGDSTKQEDVKKLMGKDKIDLVWTDPPYNVDYESADGKKIENDNMSVIDFDKFLTAAFKNACTHTKKGGCIYIAHPDSNRNVFHDAMVSGGYMAKQALVWVKNHAVLSRQDYNWRHEAILYGWKEGAAHYFCEDFTLTTIIEEDTNFKDMKKDVLVDLLNKIVLESPSTIHLHDKPSKSEDHPTMKPVSLVESQIKQSSRRKEIVFDPFGGSGTTMIAAQKANRKSRLMEFDPRYADVIVRRFEKFTGGTARHADTGETYAQTATARRG